jgi:hypothetical protein
MVWIVFGCLDRCSSNIVDNSLAYVCEASLVSQYFDYGCCSKNDLLLLLVPGGNDSSKIPRGPTHSLEPA